MNKSKDLSIVLSQTLLCRYQKELEGYNAYDIAYTINHLFNAIFDSIGSFAETVAYQLKRHYNVSLVAVTECSLRDYIKFVVDNNPALKESVIIKSQNAVKPPLGIMPEKLWKEQRVNDLIDCISRNYKQNKSNPNMGIWMDELSRLITEKN